MFQKIRIMFASGFISNLKKSVLYFGASIIGLIVSIFTTPIFARNMSSLDFSITGYFTSINGFLFPLYTLHFYSYYIMIYFKQNEEDNKKVLGSIIIFLFGWNLLFSGIAYLILFGYFRIFSVGFKLWPFVFIIIATSFFRIYSSLLQINYRVRKKAVSYFILATALKVLNIFLSIILVAKFNMGATGKLMGILIGEIAITLVTLKELRKYMNLEFDYSIIKAAFKFSFPLLIGGFAHLLITNYDRIVLERINNVTEFALYNIGAAIAGYLLLMGTSIFQAFEPDVYKFVNKKQKQKLRKYILMISVLLMFIILLFLASSRYIMAFLTDNRYTMAYMYANVLAIGVFFAVIYSYTSAILLAMERTKEALVITTFVSLIGILLYNYLVSKFEFYGAAYAKIALFVLLTLITLVFIKFKINFSRIKNRSSSITFVEEPNDLQ